LAIKLLIRLSVLLQTIFKTNFIKMKNLVKSIAFIAVVFSSVIASAQQMPQRSPQERAQNQTQWMQKNLGINEDQNKKVYDIIFKHAQEMDAARNSAAGEDRRSAMQNIAASRDADLKNVLTGEQFQKYQAHEQQAKDKMREHRSEMQNRGGN